MSRGGLPPAQTCATCCCASTPQSAQRPHNGLPFSLTTTSNTASLGCTFGYILQQTSLQFIIGLRLLSENINSTASPQQHRSMSLQNATLYSVAAPRFPKSPTPLAVGYASIGSPVERMKGMGQATSSKDMHSVCTLLFCTSRLQLV